MSPQPPAPCPHELRPGTTVCLHCRYAEHQKREARLRALLLRVGGAVAVLAAVGYGAASFLRDDGPPARAAAAVAVAEPAAPPTGPTVEPAPAAAPITPPPPAAPRAPARAAAGPIIPEGRTQLSGGVVAVRTGDTVAVHFDTPETRTRRRDKFERLVRATLPEVFGSAADSALAAVPAGRLASAGDLLTELPTRGVRLATPGGTLALWPATRPGRDGPLVVTYVATLER